MSNGQEAIGVLLLLEGAKFNFPFDGLGLIGVICISNKGVWCGCAVGGPFRYIIFRPFLLNKLFFQIFKFLFGFNLYEDQE